MNQFTFVIETDDTSALELKLGQFIPTAATNAAASAVAAVASASAAAASQTAAAGSATTAIGAATAAGVSQTAAAASASAAAGSATSAAGSASTATTQAGNASTSATAAGNSAAAAATSATNAGNSATSAATSASNAAATLANALVKGNNLSDVASPATSRTNLGLGTSAVLNTGTSGGTIPLLNAANTWALLQTFTARPSFNGNTPWDSGNLNFASPPAIGGTTPATGAFTTLSASGAITPSQTAGIVGTTTNNNAAAGSIGEYLEATSASTPLTSSTPVSLTSLSLSAGDWELQCNIIYSPSTSTTLSGAWASISFTNNALNVAPGFTSSIQIPHNPNVGDYLTSPLVRKSIASTTTVYAVADGFFSGGTCVATGFIRARRVR